MKAKTGLKSSSYGETRNTYCTLVDKSLEKSSRGRPERWMKMLIEW